MIGLILGLATAASVGFLLLWVPAETSQKQIDLHTSENAQVYQGGTFIADECPVIVAANSETPNCIMAKSEASRNSERSELDLGAQQTMALWTQVMGKAAIIGTCVGIVGLFLLFVTFWETRKAASAGRISNEIQLSAQRPWLGIELVPKLLARRGAALFLEADICARNFGKLPAVDYQLRFKILWDSDDFHVEVNRILKTFDPGEKGSRKIVLPNDTEIFSTFSGQAVSRKEGDGLLLDGKGSISPLIVISAFYKEASDSEEWLRTDGAYWITWRSKLGAASSITKSFRSTKRENLVVEPLFVSTLAD